MLGPSNDYISWDECFMRMAFLIALRSKDPKTKNGAVVVDSKNVVVGLGYNGWPRGIANDALPWDPWDHQGSWVGTKYAYVCHAEENAIYNANAKTEGCTLYCTLFPCNECAKTIIQMGIKEIVFDSDKYHDSDMSLAARQLLDLAGVKYRQYSLEK